MLKLIKVNQHKSNNAECKCHTVIGCGWAKPEKTRYVTDQDKDKDRTDIIAEINGIFTHNAADHAIQHFHAQFHHILECARNFRCMSDCSVGKQAECHNDQHDDQNTDMGCCDPYGLSKQFIRENPVYHKVHRCAFR